MTSADVSWREVRIGDLGKVVTGRTPPTSQHHLFGSDFPFITPTDINSDGRSVQTARFLSDAGRESLRKILLPSGATCFVCIGATIGKICVTDRPSFTNQQINSVVVDKARFDPAFVYYTLRTLVREVKAIAGGAATPIVNKTAFSNIVVSCPRLATQRRIASILSAYDDLIEDNTRRIAILEEMARRIYEEWFVHFKFPGHENVRMVESELGEIPEGWKPGRLDDVLVLQRGFDLPKKQRTPGPFPVFAATGQHGDHAETKARGPGVVTGRSGSLGTVVYVPTDFWPLNTTLWVKEFRLRSPLYAFFLLSSLDLEAYNSGAAVPTLNRNDVHCLPIALPPSSILEGFDQHVQPMFDLKHNLERKNSNLRTQRDLLLPKLISGEIDVSNVDVPEPDTEAA